MYDELIRRLRVNGELFQKYIPNAEGEILLQAADAIEELIAKLNHADDQIERLVEAAEERRWIPVTERLPNQSDNRLYICLIVGGEYDQLSWYELCDFDEGRFWTQLSESECHVTHWMPLPPPPEEE